jgi:hypothetical protein
MISRFSALLLVLRAAAWSQSNFGGLSGRVTDVSGGAVAAARIVIRNEGTNASLQLNSNGEGLYAASGLAPVNYSIIVEAAGFQRTLVQEVKVDTARVTTVDIVLRPGTVSEQVTVTSEAPLLQTTSGAVTNTVDQKTIVEMPLNGRNTIQLALVLPGVSGSAGTEISEFTTNEALPGRELTVNGGRIGSTQFYADGTNVTSIALARSSVSFSPDTIQEFTVLQSNYSAKYAQAGGAIIQQTTKSGSNDLRGTVYWFHRQKDFTATPFHSQRSPVTNFDNRPPLRRQQLGVVVGGPVEIPKVYRGKNRTFWLFSYEPTRQVTSDPGGPRFVRVPTDLELNGDFSRSLVYSRGPQGVVTQPWALLYNQFTRRADGTLAMRNNPAFNTALPVSATNPQFAYVHSELFNPNDPDPARRGRVLVDASGRSFVNPAAQRIARELYPRANIADPGIIADLLGANYVYFRKTEYSDNRYTVRFDHRFNDKHLVYGRWTEQPQFGDRFFRDPVGAGLISDRNKSRQIALNWTANFRPTIVNEFRASYLQGNFARNFPAEIFGRDLTSEYLKLGGPGDGAPNILGYGGARFFPGAAPTGANGSASGSSFDILGFNQPQDVGRNTEHTYVLTDDLSWMRGNHNLQMGFAASHLQLNQSALGQGSLAGGRYNFSRNQTAERFCSATPLGGNITATGCPGAVLGGDPFASFLLGMPDGLQVQTENLSNPYYYRWMNVGAYFQDDWRLRPNLTLNLGVRYQYQSPRWEKNNLQGQMNLNRLEPNPFSTPAGLPSPVFEFAGVDGRSRFLVKPQRFDFEPRLGLAWVPDFSWNAAKRLVVRLGYGLTHATLMGNDREPVPNIGAQTFGAFRAYSATLGVNDVQPPTNFVSCGLARCNDPAVPMQFGYNNPVLAGDPSLFVVPTNGLIRPSDLGQANQLGARRQDVRYNAIGFVGDQHFRTPMVQNYSLQLQYQVMANTVATVGYQGSRGTFLQGPTYNINRIDPFTGAVTVPGYNSRFSGTGIFVINPSNSASTYHALTAEVIRSFYRGLQFRFNYAWSRFIDDSSGGINFPVPNNSFNNATGDIGLTRNQNPFNSRSERAPSATDTPHVFNVVTFWDLPVGPGKRWLNGRNWVSRLAGDWQISTLGKARAGYPLSVALGQGNALDLGLPGGTQRPDRVPGEPLQNPGWTPENAWFTSFVNPRAFSWPAPGQYGNAARNISQARLPWVQTFDLSLMKRIRPWKEDRRYFELRAEVFNFFNHKVLDRGTGTATSLFSTGAQNALLTGGTNQPIAGVQHRFANLGAPGVWDAIIQKQLGAAVDTAIASLPGPGSGGVGCPATAAELSSTTATLSPACTARTLSVPNNFYVLNANTVSPRTIQFALKFYF